MRRIPLGIVLALVSLAAPSVAQGPPPPFPLHSFIDSPNRFGFNNYGPGFHITGWAYDCRTGAQPPFLAILHGDFDSPDRAYTWVTNYTVRRGLLRPDVQQAHQYACPGLTADVGFTVYPEIPLTPGRHSFAVFWSDSSSGGLAQANTVWVFIP